MKSNTAQSLAMDRNPLESLVLQGDCLKVIPTLKDGSIRAVITSPPYAEKRKGHYNSIPEKDYPAWMVSVFEAIKPKLKADGSILINIRSHVKQGAVSDYVLQTRLALRKAGWIENEELIWLKPDAPPLGSVQRPRRTWEHILWYSTCKNPFINLHAIGRMTNRSGMSRTKKAERYPDLFRGTTIQRTTAIAKVTDVFTAMVADNAKGIYHPAAFPPSLVDKLVMTFSTKGDMVLDPFAGSGTTMLVARMVGRRSVGIEFETKYVDIIHERIAKVGWDSIAEIGSYTADRCLGEMTHQEESTFNLQLFNDTLDERRRAKLRLLK